MGELAKGDDEVEEGVFLCMVIAATSFETATLSESRKEEFQNRASAFFERFPQSKVIRSVQLPTDAGAEEMLRTMKSALGITEENEQYRAQLEAKLQSGELPLPFAWRPRFALGNVQDVAHLWEVAKRSTPEDKKFHLNMSGQHWEQRPADYFRSKTPLLDLVTLLVLKDLDLLDKIFEFFPKIAISQKTLGELMKMSQAFSGSIFRGSCTELQDSLRPHLAQILQPQGKNSDEDGHLPSSSLEQQVLVGSGEYILFSDDVMVRMWILKEKFEEDGMCTLDLLCGLEELGMLTTEDVATRLAQLCDWHVGIQIQLRHQLALIPPAVRNAPRVTDAATLLRGVARFMSIANGMWGRGTAFMGSLNHIGSVVRVLVQDPSMSEAAIGAFAAIWIDHATARPDMPIQALQLAAHITLYAVAPEKLPIAAARRLWNIYYGIVESVAGSLGPKLASEALVRVAREAGALDKRLARERITPSSSIGERLMMGLDFNSDAWVAFCAAYLRVRV